MMDFDGVSVDVLSVTVFQESSKTIAMISCDAGGIY